MPKIKVLTASEDSLDFIDNGYSILKRNTKYLSSAKKKIENLSAVNNRISR